MSTNEKPKHYFLGERISEEEHLFLQELRKEEILTRCIPASIGAATLVYILSRKGHIKELDRFGAWPKTLVGAGLGVALGRVGYLTTKCQRIVEEMPNSTLSYVVRRQLGNERIHALSTEEAILSLKCKKDAFWYRALPFASILSGISLYLMKIGDIQAHPRFGIWPKTMSKIILTWKCHRSSNIFLKQVLQSWDTMLEWFCIVQLEWKDSSMNCPIPRCPRNTEEILDPG